MKAQLISVAIALSIYAAIWFYFERRLAASCRRRAKELALALENAKIERDASPVYRSKVSTSASVTRDTQSDSGSSPFMFSQPDYTPPYDPPSTSSTTDYSGDGGGFSGGGAGDSWGSSGDSGSSDTGSSTSSFD